ncbi:MAG TPA: LCP family protein [Chloroflexia bacterium]|nr:LCP family protein [Chloroflexia bacterium]
MSARSKKNKETNNPSSNSNNKASKSNSGSNSSPTTKLASSKNSPQNYGGGVPVGAPVRGSKKNRHVWRWVAGGVVLVLVAFGIYTYVRISSFVDNSFSGRNEASLLPSTPTPKPKPTFSPTALPQSTATPVQATAVTVPTVTPVPVPTATPTPEPALAPIIQKIKRGESMTALIAGYGGSGHDGAYLTDTILEVTYDPTKNAVNMVNIPRDLYVFIPYGGPKVGFYGKINSAFSYVMESQNPNILSPRYRYDPNDPKTRVDGAINLLKDVVEQVTGTPVDYWATLSFDGFRKFVDAIGGVDVNVDITFDDYEYPANDDPKIDASVKHIHFDAGPQHMMGERAIEYARSRKSAQDGNDFARSKRQMKLIAAVKEQVAKPDIMLKAFGIMDALQGSIRTSLSLDETRALMDYFRSSEGSAVASKMLFVSNVLGVNFLTDSYTADGAFILTPVNGQNNYKAIQEWLAKGREYPELRSEGLKVQVQNGSGQWNLSNKVTTELDDNGFDTVQPIWAQTTASSVILDYSDGKATRTLSALNDLIPGLTVKPMKKPGTQSPDIVVLLGKDFEQLPANSVSKPETGDSVSSQAANLPGATATASTISGNLPDATVTVSSQDYAMPTASCRIIEPMIK